MTFLTGFAFSLNEAEHSTGSRDDSRFSLRM